jgi:hypothetical protein
MASYLVKNDEKSVAIALDFQTLVCLCITIKELGRSISCQDVVKTMYKQLCMSLLRYNSIMPKNKAIATDIAQKVFNKAKNFDFITALFTPCLIISSIYKLLTVALKLDPPIHAR